MKNKVHYQSIFITALSAIVMSSASFAANVSLQNGNMFTVFKDAIMPGGLEMKIERNVNSKDGKEHMFGFGMGSEHEVRLVLLPDRTIVVNEFGGGAENVFTPKAFNEAQLERAAILLANAAKKANIVTTAKDFNAYKARLKTDAQFRRETWEKLVGMKLVQPETIPVGTQLISNKYAYQYITKVADGYVRTTESSGKIEKFDESGKLVKVSDKNGNFIDFKYLSDGHLERMKDNFNRPFNFQYNKLGLVSEIEGIGGKKATYKYNDLKEMVDSIDFDGNHYTYKYDTGGRHNMTEIGYSDGTKMSVTYYDQKLHENVKSLTERDGTKTEYNYIYDPSDRGHLTVTALMKDAKGVKISDSKYEYFRKYKKDGEEWLYRLVATLDGDKTETTYSECCGVPLLIKHGKETTVFAYDEKGHVTKKDTPYETTVLTYDSAAGKVAKVVRTSKTNKKDTTWSTFRYNEKGNLVVAKDSAGRTVQLLYDGNGRIRMMVDSNKHSITFKYNEESKPIEITDPAVGTLTVDYENDGSVKKVDSTAGRAVALQVASSFESLLSIIRPAGVTLSF